MDTVDYKLIKNFFSKEELEILQIYCYNKLDSNKDYQLDNQSFSPAWYRDSLMIALLSTKLTKVEEESNLKLFPTYSWPIVVEGTSFELEEGDAILYAGCDQLHERPDIYKGEGMAQVFFHYVNQNGPNRNHAYDAYYKEKNAI